MQDPGGDGKIVYLFLPLYEVRTTALGRCLPSDVRTTQAQRPKDDSYVACLLWDIWNTGSSVTQINRVIFLFVLCE
jgi:hypothetical protein